MYAGARDALDLQAGQMKAALGNVLHDEQHLHEWHVLAIPRNAGDFDDVVERHLLVLQGVKDCSLRARKPLQKIHTFAQS
ncbi:hypothetical protein D3C71_1968970 [compost metagenome]